MAHRTLIETPYGAIYSGTMLAEVYEVTPPGQAATRHLIRTDQKWGVNVKWEMTGELVTDLEEEFHLEVLLESIGRGREINSDPVVVPTTPGESYDVGDPNNNIPPKRTYSQKVEFNPGDVPPGTYKVVTSLQLFGKDSGPAWPVAGFCEGPIFKLYIP